jgi:hypothetical protein
MYTDQEFDSKKALTSAFVGAAVGSVASGAFDGVFEGITAGSSEVAGIAGTGGESLMPSAITELQAGTMGSMNTLNIGGAAYANTADVISTGGDYMAAVGNSGFGSESVMSNDFMRNYVENNAGALDISASGSVRFDEALSLYQESAMLNQASRNSNLIMAGDDYAAIGDISAGRGLGNTSALSEGINGSELWGFNSESPQSTSSDKGFWERSDSFEASAEGTQAQDDPFDLNKEYDTFGDDDEFEWELPDLKDLMGMGGAQTGASGYRMPSAAQVTQTLSGSAQSVSGQAAGGLHDTGNRIVQPMIDAYNRQQQAAQRVANAAWGLQRPNRFSGLF